MNDYLVALLLGFSFGNLWLCALLVFSLQTTNRSTCAGYLLGRILAIIALAVVIAAVGQMVFISKGVLNIVSGVLLLGFSLYLAATRLWHWVPFWKTARVAHSHEGDDCGHNCTTCPAQGHAQYMLACESCADKKLCAAEESEVEPITRGARVAWKRDVQDKDLTGFGVGIGLGAVRGATLCSKLMVLVPILLGASLSKAFGLGLLFSLSSTIYPLLGFTFGEFALKLIKYKSLMFSVACIFLALAGIRYLYLGLLL